MLSLVIRSLNRHSFKSIHNQNYVKRFYSNQDFQQKTADDDYTDRYFRFHDWDDTSRVYHEYYKKYYDNFKNKFDNSSDRQTDNEKNGHKSRNNKKFNSNSYSFSECKYHLFTKRLVEKIGYIGAAIVVGLHFEAPLYYSYNRKQCRYIYEQLNTTGDDSDTCSSNVCGKCKYCSALLSKFRIFSAPIRKQYIFAKSRYLESNHSKIVEVEEAVAQAEETPCEPTSETLHIKESTEERSDPIEDICRQLQTASIDYIDRLNNMLGIALIETDPKQAMQCWSSTKTSPKALFNMGVAFERGLHSGTGVSDMKKAFQYYTLSASMGHKLAIYNLSLFYLLGKGDVPIDYDRAETLLRRAAQLGVERAQNYIEKLEKRRMAQMTQNSRTMRSSASAPDLMVWGNCFESFNHNENVNRFPQNYSIANRV